MDQVFVDLYRLYKTLINLSSDNTLYIHIDDISIEVSGLVKISCQDVVFYMGGLGFQSADDDVVTTYDLARYYEGKLYNIPPATLIIITQKINTYLYDIQWTIE